MPKTPDDIRDLLRREQRLACKARRQAPRGLHPRLLELKQNMETDRDPGEISGNSEMHSEYV